MNANPHAARRGRGTRARGEAGQALIETAVALPVLLLIVLGIAQFGIAFSHYIMLTDAVRVAARQLANGRYAMNPCLAAAQRMANSASPTLSPASIMATMTVTTLSGTTMASGSPPGAPSCQGAGTNMVAGGNAIVSATYPCNLVIYGIDFAVGGPCTLTAQTQVRIE